MADEQPKKIRTEKQLAAQAATKDNMAAAKQWLLARGLPPNGPSQMIVRAAMKKSKENGTKLSNSEIEELLRKKKNNMAAKKVEKKNTTVKNKAPNAKPNNKTNKAPKVRSAAQMTAAEKSKKMMQNAVAALNAAGVKYGSNSISYYFAQRKAGRSNSEVLAEMKAKFPKFNETGKKVVSKRTVKAKPAAPAAVAPLAPAANVSAPKGSYVCEKCRLVANNTTRKRANSNNLSYLFD